MTSHAQQNDIDGFFSSDRVAGREEAVELDASSFREYLIPLDDPTLADVRGMDYEEFTADRYQAPFLRELLNHWKGLYEEPFVGVTSDGTVQDVWHLDDGPAAGSAAAESASALLASLSPAERAAVRYPIDAPEWRSWSNPEFVFFRTGLRLDHQKDEVVEAALAVVEASLSVEGYARVRETMGLNGYLGELVDLPRIMNDRSYWFALYGEPGAGPWGWQLFGHHVAVHSVFAGARQVIAPVFLGGEPALSDDDRRPLFDARERDALDLAASLSQEQRDAAIVYASVLDPAMPEGRLHPADERHVAGAFRDNRIVPYEGIQASDLTDAQWNLLRSIVEDFHRLLPEEQLALTLAEIDAHRDVTRFSWYGATDGTQPFYFRIQSPVVLAELDHHAGVWLSNRLPARFHVHTTLRLPNGNDYGTAFRAAMR
ncbi:DUF3500 domain-containing protein [Microbacterium sp.]|uniref:DUF3500 domain-containing protein n=1 Tax=Microbacterium sp. TaxID=51671 RepID=UPI00289B1832|nr:DUF3500 domain-containing protein [Microbacterium sp.]